MSVVSSNPRFDVEEGVSVEGNKSSFGKKALLAAVGIVAIVGAAVATTIVVIQQDSSTAITEGCVGECQVGASAHPVLEESMRLKRVAWEKRHMVGASRGDSESRSQGFTACNNGFANGYPCSNVDLLSQTSLSALGNSQTNEAQDIWGAVVDNKELALVTLNNGLSVVDITSPSNPKPLAYMAGTNSLWHDCKTYGDYVFQVADTGSQGLQILNLNRVVNFNSLTTVTPDFTYKQFGKAHNVVINEQTGRAYVVGSDTCGGGLHTVDISNPLSPTFIGCLFRERYVHDVHTVVYSGPDSRYTGKEIIFMFCVDYVIIMDVTNAAQPVELSRFTYATKKYIHQGDLDKTMSYLLVNDELDHENGPQNTRTFTFDVRDLQEPVQIGTYSSQNTAIDHNLYVKEDHAYLSNYGAGLRVLDLNCISSGALTEVAYFDVSPSSTTPEFKGAWSSYIYYPSGNIALGSLEGGLFVLKANLPALTQCQVNPSPSPSPAPAEEWICNPSYQNANDGCDCGCGAVDQDCQTSYRNLYCGGTASQSTSATRYKCDITAPNGGKCVLR